MNEARSGPTTRRRERPEIVTPGERAQPSMHRRVVAFVLAVLLPPVAALVMLPLRDEHSQIVAVILVAPVVGVALLGATGPAVVAALTAGLAFDVAHTEPYWRPVIDDPDDIATVIALLAVAITVGVLCSRVVQLAARATGRHDELRHLVHFARTTTGENTTGVDALAGEVCEHLVELLGLRACRWSPGPQDDEGPILLPTGAVMGLMTALNPDRAKLPDHLDIPAVSGAQDLGRFVLSPDRQRVVSVEERLTAATIVQLFAHEVAARGD